MLRGRKKIIAIEIEFDNTMTTKTTKTKITSKTIRMTMTLTATTTTTTSSMRKTTSGVVKGALFFHEGHCLVTDTCFRTAELLREP